MLGHTMFCMHSEEATQMQRDIQGDLLLDDKCQNSYTEKNTTIVLDLTKTLIIVFICNQNNVIRNRYFILRLSTSSVDL